MANEKEKPSAPTAPEAPKPTLDDLKTSMQAWSTTETAASFEKACRKVCEEYGALPKAFNQAANALAGARAIRAVDAQFAPKALGGRYEPEAWKQILALLYRIGNASANRQALEDKKVSGLAASLIADSLG